MDVIHPRCAGRDRASSVGRRNHGVIAAQREVLLIAVSRVSPRAATSA